MRVLIVARCKRGRYAPFITEQVDALMEEGVDIQYFGVTRKGLIGYLREVPRLRKAIRVFRPDIIHAHYGLCGVLANIQRGVPVVTTYHGSDINIPKVLRLSKIAIRRSRSNIFVSQRNIDIAKPRKNFALIPCGINLDDYPYIEQSHAREQMGLTSNKKYILFAGAFDNPIKNAPLAQAAIKLIPDAELLELKGYSRQQVATLMQAVDAFLMTSFTEGSPQVIKEALASGCPIVSVDVGDIRELLTDVEGCYIVNRNVEHIKNCLEKAITGSEKTGGREVIIEKHLTNECIAHKIISIYSSVI